jgi:hypothetical protein
VFTLRVSGDPNSWTYAWTVQDYQITSPIQAGGQGGDSTAETVIGDVTVDLDGFQDDATGSISGTANQLLRTRSTSRA